MLAVVVAFHKSDNPDHLKSFEEMLASIEFKGSEKDIFITLDGASPEYLEKTLEKFKIPVENVIFSTEKVGNYVLKFRFIDLIKQKYRFVKFCDFDDKSCTLKKLLRICEENKDFDLICCRSSKWSLFVNYWEKIFSTRLLTAIPKFKVFTGGDVIICWMSFYLCFKNNWNFIFNGEMIYFKQKEASRTCRELRPDEYLKLETDSNEIKNILFYCQTIESKHIYSKSENILDIDLQSLKKTVELNDFICKMTIHYKF